MKDMEGREDKSMELKKERDNLCAGRVGSREMASRVCCLFTRAPHLSMRRVRRWVKLFDLEKEGYFYSRLQNPTCDTVAQKICDLEGGAWQPC